MGSDPRSGFEAEKTAQYLACDDSLSFIFCKLQHRQGFVGKTLLMSVIMSILASCPDRIRPTPPGRSMKDARVVLLLGSMLMRNLR
jgi:hypothetical protein